MTVAVSVIQTKLLNETGLAATSTALTARICTWVNDAVSLWWQTHQKYYIRDVSYKPATIAAALTDTATVDGTDVYKITFGTLTDAVLNGAMISLTSVGGTVRTVATKVCRMQAPTRGMSTGTATVYQRSVIHDSSRTGTIYKPYKSWGTWTGTTDEGRIQYIAPEYFFCLSDIDDCEDPYPTYYTWSGGAFIINSHWALTPIFTVHFKAILQPTQVVDGTSTIDAPDPLAIPIAEYVIARYKQSAGYPEANVLLSKAASEILRFNVF